MNTEQLCMGCMSDKGTASICPKCGYNENKKQKPFVLSHRTILHDQFMIGRILGKPGGFGITYLGWDLKLETSVAIKEYLPRDLASRDTDRSTVIPYSREDGELFNYGLKQFLQEARTLAKFDHANVMRVRTFFEENDTAYLVMDYYEGDLRPVIQKEPYPLQNGDKFLLCTDGFWEYVTETEMEVDLAKSNNPDEWLQKMELRIQERAKKGHDNYSAIAVFVE